MNMDNGWKTNKTTGGKFKINKYKEPVVSTSSLKSKIKTGATGTNKKVVISKVKQLLGDNAKVFNNFANKSKPTDNNASKCKTVARCHDNPYTGFMIVQTKDSKGTNYSTIAHDFNVINNKAVDYVNHKSAKTKFKNTKTVAYVGVPLNPKYKKKGK